MITRAVVIVLSLSLCQLTRAAAADDDRPVSPAAQKERDDALRKARQAYDDAAKAANAKYAAALKAELSAAMKKTDLERANRIDRELKSLADTSATAPFDLRRAIITARYYSDAKDFDITAAVAAMATPNKLEIPQRLWAVVQKDPNPGNRGKFLQVTVDLGGYVVDFRTELFDDVTPTIAVTPKAK